MRILLVGEDGPWRAGVCAYLVEEGFQVRLASDPDENEALLGARSADLIVLQTPNGGGGLSLCRRLSTQDGAPVILVSDRAEEFDRIIGLEVGADDFVSQTCSHRELLARIRAVLRRQVRGGATAPVVPIGISERVRIRFAGWTLSPWKLEVRSPEGKCSVLTMSDFKLLSALLKHPQETITRERMMRMLGLFDTNPRSLDAAVCRLRQKLGSTSAGEPVIRTVRAVGYILDCPVETEDSLAAAAEFWRRRRVG